MTSHSTTTALIDIYENLVDKAERGMTPSLLALDQSSAYDVVDHPILLKKLKAVGLDIEMDGILPQ